MSSLSNEIMKIVENYVNADVNEWNNVDAVVAEGDLVAWKGGSYGEGEYCFL